MFNLEKTKFKNILINFSLLVIVLVILFFVLELSVRYFAPQYKKSFQSNPVVGITRIPESNFSYFDIASGKKITHYTNKDGFKSPNYSLEKPDNTFRIVLLGDSMTEAIQVPDDKSHRFFLENKLKNELNKNFEVISLGYSGYGTAQEYLSLKEFGLKYKPDLVILNFLTDNDVANNSQKLENGSTKPFFEVKDNILVQTVTPNISKKNSFFSFLTDQFVLPRFLYRRYEIFKSNLNTTKKAETQVDVDIRANVYYKDYTEDWLEAWDITLHLILEIQKLSELSNSKFLLVSIPAGRQVIPSTVREYEQIGDSSGHPLDVKKPDNILSDFTAKKSINFLPLFNDFQTFSNNEELYIKHDGHLSIKGHELLANKLTQYIIEKDIFSIK